MRQRANYSPELPLSGLVRKRPGRWEDPDHKLDVVVQRGILMMLMRLQRKLKTPWFYCGQPCYWRLLPDLPKPMGIMYSGSLAELGETEDIFNDPSPPVTKMLIEALPPDRRQTSRAGIPGGRLH